VAAENDPHVDPAIMPGFAQALGGGAEDLRNRLAELDNHVGDMLQGWRGASGSGGSAYTAAWELWHRGAGEVQVGLSILAKLIAHGAASHHENQENRVTSAHAVAKVGNV
jgi:uncharacterized protein YukE